MCKDFQHADCDDVSDAPSDWAGTDELRGFGTAWASTSPMQYAFTVTSGSALLRGTWPSCRLCGSASCPPDPRGGACTAL